MDRHELCHPRRRQAGKKRDRVFFPLRSLPERRRNLVLHFCPRQDCVDGIAFLYELAVDGNQLPELRIELRLFVDPLNKLPHSLRVLIQI